MLLNELSGFFRAQGIRGDLVDHKGDLVLREELPHLDAGGSPLEIVKNRFSHDTSSILSANHPSTSFIEREGGGKF